MQNITGDVLVIGGGVAGMESAYAAAQAGARVVHVLKSRIGQSGSSSYVVTEASGYGLADGARDPDDSPAIHFQDIMEAGRGMADPRLAKILTERAPETRPHLENLGVRFEKDNTGSYLVTQGCFGSKPRNYTLRDHGTRIIRALASHTDPIRTTIVEQCMVTDLIVDNGICLGALGLLETGEEVRIKTKATILCTGGAGNLFSTTLNPHDVIGDGYALGLKAGANLMNMEFMQFGCGVCAPGFSILNSWIWSLHPNVTDITHNDIFEGVLPPTISKEMVMDRKSTHYPFSSENISRYVEIAIQKSRIGGTEFPHGGVSLDVSEQLASTYPGSLQLFKDMWEISNKWYLSRGIDVAKGPIGINCFAHAVNGGMKIDTKAQTSIEGLYAAGEAAAGPHGADRLGGNMLPSCVVFGSIAGTQAAQYAQRGHDTRHTTTWDTLAESILERRKKVLDTPGPRSNPKICIPEIKRQMGLYMMTVRTASRLQELQSMLFQNKESFLNNGLPIRHPFSPFESMHAIITASLMVDAALQRKESRGSHFREDFPETDGQYGSPYIQSRKNLPDFKEIL